MFRDEGAANNPPTIELGVVLSSNPLKIKVGDLQLTKQNLLVSDFLLSNYERKISINNSTPNTYKTEDTLQVGDTIVVIPTANMQTYVVLARVV